VVGKSLGALLLGGEGTSIQLDTSLDIRVFGFAALAAVVAAMLIGLVPALQATSGNLSDHIKDGQHATQAHERRRILPRALMSLEVALALMLVVGAGLLASSLVKLYRSGAGFDPRGVENIAFSMDKQPLKGEALMQFYRELGNGLSHQPGVTAASFAMIVPLTHRIWDDEFTPIGGKAQDLDLNAVAPDYFEAMRIPMLAGRDVRWTDTRSTGMKIILNRAAANLLLPGREAVGQHLFTHDDKGQVDYEVIGVVGDAKYEDMRSEAPAGGYIPLALDDHDRHSYNAVVRMDGAAAPLAGAARALATRMAPGIPAPVMTSMTSVMDDSLSAERLMALLSVFFAGCALFVTAIGLYGTLAYAK
jgi:hypothetical protein